MKVDLNSDLGESFGAYTIGQDEAVIPLVSSVNVACGFHAGDYLVMKRTVELAKAYRVAIGAHPGFPDLHGFGRRNLPLPPDEVYAAVLYQIGALSAFTRAADVSLEHVKPHGALYNTASADDHLAVAIAQAVYDFSPDLILFALSGSKLAAAGRNVGLQVAEEAFVDRGYHKDGSLVSRSRPDAFVTNPKVAAERVIGMLTNGQVDTVDGDKLNLQAQTLCIHGDGPHAVAFAKAVREYLLQFGADIASARNVLNG